MKHPIHLLVTLFLGLLLAACSVGTVEPPDREIEVTMEDAIAAQNTILSAFSTGQVTLSEAQLSSFLTELLRANTGPNQPVESVTAWIEPEMLHIRLALKEGVLREGAGNTLDLVGNFVIVDNQIQVELQQAAYGALVAGEPLLQIFVEQTNDALAENLPVLPLNISQESGSLTVGLAPPQGTILSSPRCWLRWRWPGSPTF